LAATTLPYEYFPNMFDFAEKSLARVVKLLAAKTFLKISVGLLQMWLGVELFYTIACVP